MNCLISLQEMDIKKTEREAAALEAVVTPSAVRC